jgi:hypothetical protein
MRQLCVLVLSAVTSIATLAVPAAALSAAAAPASGRAWHAIEVRPPAHSLSAEFFSLSCPGPGSCEAGGAYLGQDTLGLAAIAATESAGTWGAARPIPMPAGAQDSMVNGIACVAVRSCVAVGQFRPSNGPDHAFIATRSGRAWARARQVLLPAGAISAGLGAVTCTAPGTCVAVGGGFHTASGSLAPMVVTESHGRWARPKQLQVPAHDMFGLSSVSCTSTGSCVAVGGGPFAAIESRGRWGRVRQIPVPASLGQISVVSVSCVRRHGCVVIGGYMTPAQQSGNFSITERNGHWGPVAKIAVRPKGGHFPRAYNTVSCTGAAFCVAVGSYSAGLGIAATFAHGRWGGAVVIHPPANAILSGPAAGSGFAQVVCFKSGICKLAGSYEAAPDDVSVPMIATR